jgi:thiol-disulfide isomerase/thioredoxin
MKLLYSLLLFFTFSTFAAAPAPVSVTAPATELALDTLKGKVVLLDFWASWCGPCRQSFPWLNQMQQKYGAEGLVILAINEDEERADAEFFLKKYPAQFSLVFDKNGKLASQYQLQGMPTSILLDRKGQIRFSHAGFFQKKAAGYEQEIQQLLQEDAK